jgi:metal-responsive CopG/Arc/MetJ family transcriptional regulator
MEIVSVKFQETILKKIDSNIKKHNFNSRTEFIREAVRDKLAVLTKEELIEEFMKFKGKAKKKTTREENRKTQENVLKQLAKEKGWEI